MKKEQYIALIERIFSSYSDEHIRDYTARVKSDGLREHGYPRLVANLGILIAHGKRREYKDEFRTMMDLCCDEIPTAYQKYGVDVGNDFSVKEIVLCLLELEEAKVFDKEVTDEWRAKLAKINPCKIYSVRAGNPPVRANNWAAFNAASEQLRKYAGIGDESEFIDNQISSQLLSFDEMGMYRDPHEPMVYDMVTRLQLAVSLYFGYDGANKEALEEELLKSGDITLKMQSVTGEIPYGGRSAQFLHNETFYAALCEFYASLFKQRGDLVKAGQFKSAARLAIESIMPWFQAEPISHVKNYYPIDSKYGCEGYAYFDKYMITTASWTYLAYVMDDEDIKEVPCPALEGKGISVTSDCFHKIFCCYNDYFVEIDTNANPQYDASGIGRIHKKGAPSAICLSVPTSKEPSYFLDLENPSDFAICGGIKTDDGYVYTYETQTKYTLLEKKEENNSVSVRLKCETENGQILYQTCTVSDDGVEISIEGDGEVEVLFPMFDFDGRVHTEISVSEKCASVSYKGYRCNYETDGVIIDKNTVYGNRNGHYKAAAAVGEGKVTLKVRIDSL